MKRLTSVGLIALSAAIAPATRAQYTANFQTNIISGVTSNWVGIYYVGNTNSADVLLIQNGGVLNSGMGYLGYSSGSSNNTVLVTGTGSTWNSSGGAGLFGVGNSTSGNSLNVSNAGAVYIRGTPDLYGTNNSLLVTSPGSVCSNDFLSMIGFSNSLVVSGGGHAISNGGSINGSMNRIVVTDTGSVWSSTGFSFSMADTGTGNTAVITNGGTVVSSLFNIGRFGGSSSSVRVVDGGNFLSAALLVGGFSNSVTVAAAFLLATNLTIGNSSTSCENWLQLDSGSIIVTNAATNAVLEVRYGKLIFNGGTLQVDRFVMTNSCAQFVRTGGILIYGSAVLTTNLDADCDGIPNGWEQAYGLDPLNAADASADNDGDGFSSLQEFQSGTDPTNSASAFRILSVVPTNDNLLISWAAGGGRTNVVQAAADLTVSYTNLSQNIVLTGSGDVTTNYPDAGAATNAPVRFYRIRLVP